MENRMETGVMSVLIRAITNIRVLDSLYKLRLSTVGLQAMDPFNTLLPGALVVKDMFGG